MLSWTTDISGTLSPDSTRARDISDAQMGVAQSEISRIEKRHDMLLSTLTSYLSAAGEHPRVVVTVNGKDVELDLTTLAGRTLRLDAASKFAALDHGFASRRIGSVSAALPGQVDARLHVDGLELRGWTRYQSIRFTDRTLTAVVQSACNKPVSTLITHDHVRSAHGAWMAGPCRIPKLTVRVRFPSPAPHAKNVAIHTNWAPFSFWNGARRHQKSALVPLPRAISHLGECPWRLSV